MSDSKLQSLLRQHMQAYIESTPLNLFDEICATVARGIMPAQCQIVFTREAYFMLSVGQIGALANRFKEIWWRNVPGIAFAIVEIK